MASDLSGFTAGSERRRGAAAAAAVEGDLGMEVWEDLRRLKTGRRRGPRPVRVAVRYVFLGVGRGSGMGVGDAILVGELDGSSMIFVPMGVSRRRRALLWDSLSTGWALWAVSGFFRIG